MNPLPSHQESTFRGPFEVATFADEPIETYCDPYHPEWSCAAFESAEPVLVEIGCPGDVHMITGHNCRPFDYQEGGRTVHVFIHPGQYAMLDIEPYGHIWLYCDEPYVPLDGDVVIIKPGVGDVYKLLKDAAGRIARFMPGVHRIGMHNEYVSQGLIRPGTTVELMPGSKLVPDIDWRKQEKNFCLLESHDADGVTVCGRGVLDSYGHMGKPIGVRGFCLKLRNGQGVNVSGITIRDPLMCGIELQQCQNFWIRGVKHFMSPRWYSTTYRGESVGRNARAFSVNGCRYGLVSGCTATSSDSGLCTQVGTAPVYDVLWQDNLVVSGTTGMSVVNNDHPCSVEYEHNRVLWARTAISVGFPRETGQVDATFRYTHVDYLDRAEPRRILARAHGSKTEAGEPVNVTIDGLRVPEEYDGIQLRGNASLDLRRLEVGGEMMQRRQVADLMKVNDGAEWEYEA